MKKSHTLGIFNRNIWSRCENVRRYEKVGEPAKGAGYKKIKASLKHNVLKDKCVWRVQELVLREEGTACNVSCQKGVTNAKILRFSYILTRLLCQCLTLLLIWSISCGMARKGRGFREK